MTTLTPIPKTHDQQTPHTPGPWTHDQTGFIYSADGTVCCVIAGSKPDSLAQLRADANLIAAAPQLLAEAIELLQNAEYADGLATVKTQDCEALQTAIAKAEGRAS